MKHSRRTIFRSIAPSGGIEPPQHGIWSPAGYHSLLGKSGFWMGGFEPPTFRFRAGSSDQAELHPDEFGDRRDSNPRIEGPQPSAFDHLATATAPRTGIEPVHVRSTAGRPLQGAYEAVAERAAPLGIEPRTPGSSGRRSTTELGCLDFGGRRAAFVALIPLAGKIAVDGTLSPGAMWLWAQLASEALVKVPPRGLLVHPELHGCGTKIETRNCLLCSELVDGRQNRKSRNREGHRLGLD
jgi:hypothetical protein